MLYLTSTYIADTKQDNMGETVDVLVVGKLLRCRVDQMLTRLVKLLITVVGPAAVVFPLLSAQSSMIDTQRTMTRNRSKIILQTSA
jgi:hypothetical protein